MRLHTDGGEIRYVTSADADIAARVTGSGMTDFVLVPGVQAHLVVGREHPERAAFLGALAGHGRLIEFDPRGSGMSSALPGGRLATLMERAEEVDAVLSAVSARRPVLIATGDAGPAAMLTAARHRNEIRALVLIGTAARMTPAPGYPHGAPGVLAYAAISALGREWGTGEGLWRVAPTRAHDPQLRAWWARAQGHACPGPQAVSAMAQHLATDVRSVLSSITAPTLVLHAAHDIPVAVAHGRFLADHIAGACFVELPGADHLEWLGNAERVVQEILKFLRAGSVPELPRPPRSTVDEDLPAVLIDLVNPVDDLRVEPAPPSVRI